MHTKERFYLTVRLLCFGILLTAVGLRFGGVFFAQSEKPPESTEKTYPTMIYEPTERSSLTFTEDDAALVPILNWSGAQVDAQRLIQQPLELSVTDEPLILILHTHATEAYADTADYRSTDPSCNVVRIGAVLAESLKESGIAAIHDTTLIDLNDYYDAYDHAAQIIENYLKTYPSIRMVIDVHRDSVTDAQGNQIPLTAQIGKETAAQLMLVMGTDTSGLPHPEWEKNLSFALQLQALCAKEMPGLFRSLNLRSQRYNQHLTPHSILLEVGSAGNTLGQAETACRLLAKQLSKLILQ